MPKQRHWLRERTHASGTVAVRILSRPPRTMRPEEIKGPYYTERIHHWHDNAGSRRHMIRRLGDYQRAAYTILVDKDHYGFRAKPSPSSAHSSR